MDSSITHIRPRFRFIRTLPSDQIKEKLVKALEESPAHISGRITGTHITIDIVGKERHFWSPHLDFRIEPDEDDPDKTVIAGLIGPSPAVWTLFMFIYFGLALIGFVLFSYGVSNWMMGKITFFLWALPITILFMTTAYKAGKYGEQLGADQIEELKEIIRNSIG